MEWGTPMTRITLSLKIGVVGGFTWGIFFTAYYSMLQNFEFAWKSATLCFVSIIVVFLGLPSLIREFKKVDEERKMRKKNE